MKATILMKSIFSVYVYVNMTPSKKNIRDI